MELSEGSFCGELVARDPLAKDLYSEHLRRYGSELPHVFLGSWVANVVERFRNNENYSLAQPVVEFLEAAVNSRDEHVRNLMGASFFENVVTERAARERILNGLLPRSRSELEKWIVSHSSSR